jgi:lipopolysaccharide export system protein LptA
MKYKLLSIFLMISSLNSSELQIKANSFSADESSGVSVFTGKVNIKKSNDELNASQVTVYTDKNNEPTKFVAIGSVSFTVQTEKLSIYKGVAGKAIYSPSKKEYHFFQNVHLRQIDEKKEIIGDEVLLNTIEGKAYAKGVESEPVIMIFNIADKNASVKK